jgi:cell wall-associated NlpC family hydrolase
MKRIFTLLLLLILSFYTFSCASSSSAEKRKHFELQNNSPIGKNITPLKVFFKEDKKDKKKDKKRVAIKNKTKKDKKSKKEIKKNKREELVKYALKFNGHSRVKKDKKFRNDCSGFVRSVYDNFDIELYNTTKVKRGKHWLNGTEVIYNFVKDNGKVFKKGLPVIGDIIFFDNTTDRNRDGKVNDKFTHIAIVTKVNKNGTIHYIHKSNRGINIQKLNLKYSKQVYIKSGKKKIKVNSYLRKKRKKDKRNTPYLSSQMFRSFGSLFK